MGIASLILGIISVLFALIPVCGMFVAPLPALIGLVLGIVDWVGKSKQGLPKGVAVAGTVISVIAFVVLAGWVGLFVAQKPADQTWEEFLEQSSEGMEEFQKGFEEGLEEAAQEAQEAANKAEEAAKKAEDAATDAQKAVPQGQ